LSLLPEHADFRALPGGTHINFGRFLPAPRFRSAEPPALPIDEQHAPIVGYTLDFVNELQDNGSSAAQRR
jgi:hypothetical protein